MNAPIEKQISAVRSAINVRTHTVAEYVRKGQIPSEAADVILSGLRGALATLLAVQAIVKTLAQGIADAELANSFPQGGVTASPTPDATETLHVEKFYDATGRKVDPADLCEMCDGLGLKQAKTAGGMKQRAIYCAACNGKGVRDLSGERCWTCGGSTITQPNGALIGVPAGIVVEICPKCDGYGRDNPNGFCGFCNGRGYREKSINAGGANG